jgi:hypothetical protein
MAMSDVPRTSGIYQIRCVPTGKIYVGGAVNLRARWYEHQRRLRRGSHRGWTYNSDRQNFGFKTYTGFIAPSGVCVTIRNLAVFCREHGLHPVHMHQLKSGQRKRHKGWTWRDPDEQD